MLFLCLGCSNFILHCCIEYIQQWTSWLVLEGMLQCGFFMSVSVELTCQFEVEINLRATVSRPVHLGVGPLLEQMTRF
jgi:hypothetical protein